MTQRHHVISFDVHTRINYLYFMTAAILYDDVRYVWECIGVILRYTVILCDVHRSDTSWRSDAM